ncbi:uncharacterized protein F5147DRAFT_713759 [Suillus discolor]|uniref:Meiotic sister chromatid recombination protein 1 n=1 Tax=Suillus discolor TaxID=1912936 RepID=A0A9P7JQK0_9AGAM|nr:uncharacterized protein F5147DRAFT_713759 [Suillus discolor]KAG2098385.1 hypothetical protein F5147DRAFT_713759 [Suillus discolor]
MHFRRSVYVILFIGSAYASSWFGSEYDKWSHSDLHFWLEDHHIKVPSHFDQSQLHDLVAANWASPPPPPPSFAEQSRAYADASRQWSYDRYTRAQHAFQDLQENSFDTWDESKLRAFLLEHGVVAPSGPREQLLLLAKQKHRSYINAASYYSSIASETATSAYSDATDTLYHASKSASSVVAQATHDVVRAFDDSRDYVYSAWDDNYLRSWLEDHGVVEARKASTRTELTKLANDYCRTAVEPVWNVWSDSYMREWLISHNLLSPSDTASRSTLLGEMKKYYYSSPDKVWSVWSDSELKSWLVKHGLLNSDAQKKRDELVKMVEDNYASASDSVWDAWNDSDIRRWLSQHGYTDDRNFAQKKRDELVSLIDRQYNDVSTRTAAYLVWPDARLRAYLRERGVSEAALPTNRPGLLQETRIRWVQTSNRAETIFTKLNEIINSGVGAVEDRLARILELLSGHLHYASEKTSDARAYAEDKKDSAWHWCSQKGDNAKGKNADYAECAKSKLQEQGFNEKVKGAAESIKWGGEKMKSAGDEL